MDLILIAAASENNVIGIKGEIPWKIPEDMERFKNFTLNHPVIMGRTTYETIPKKFRPLPQRKNIVVSRTIESKENIFIARSLEEALGFTEEKDSYIIGGGKIYSLFFPFATRIELTRVHKKYEGDTFFPEISFEEWDLVKQEKKKSKTGIEYSFLSYKRKN